MNDFVKHDENSNECLGARIFPMKEKHKESRHTNSLILLVHKTRGNYGVLHYV